MESEIWNSHVNHKSTGNLPNELEEIDGGTRARTLANGQKLLKAIKDKRLWRVMFLHVLKGDGT